MSPIPPRILIVEDVPAIAAAAAAHLRAGGFECHVAGNGAAALAVARELRPDLVLADIMMPVVDGIEFLRRAKSVEALRGVPILMLSAVHERDRVMQCLLLGAVDYVPKPFEPAALLRKVRKHLSSKPRDGASDEAPAAAESRPRATSVPENAAAASATTRGSRAIALVAATAPDVIEALRGELDPHFSVHVVADGATALDVAASHPPRVVVAESRLAVFDGVEVLAKVRATAGSAPVALAIVLSRTEADAARRAREVAGVEVLSKPIERAAVARFVETVLAPEAPREDRCIASPTGGQTDVHFDPSALEPLRELPPDADGRAPVDQIIEAFLSDAPQRIAALKSALQAGDKPALAAAAHALKGGSGSVGARAIESLSRELEASAKEGGAPAKAQELAAAIPRLEESLARYSEAVAGWRKR